MNLKGKLLVCSFQNCVNGKNVEDQQQFRVDYDDAGPLKLGSSKTNQLHITKVLKVCLNTPGDIEISFRVRILI